MAKSCDLSASKDINCSSKISVYSLMLQFTAWLGAKRTKIDRFVFVKALSGKLMPKQSRGFSNLRWLEPGNVYQVCITNLLFSIGWIIICLKSKSFNWTPCSIIISKSGTHLYYIKMTDIKLSERISEHGHIKRSRNFRSVENIALSSSDV